MKIVFSTKKLESVMEDKPVKWLPVNVIKAARKQIIRLSCATDENDLINTRSFYYKTLAGDRKGLKSVRLNKKWRIIFDLDLLTDPPTIEIKLIEDSH